MSRHAHTHIPSKPAAPHQHAMSLKDTPMQTGNHPPSNFVREGVTRLNPAQAAFVLRQFAYARNRDVSKAQVHVATLTEIMRRGGWTPREQIAFARLGGRLILMNGHHRMAAQAASGVDIEWSIVIHDCRSESEVAALYTTFDTNIRKRSDENVMSALDVAAILNVNSRFARGAWRAAPFLAVGLDTSRGANIGLARSISDERLRIVRVWERETQELQRAMSTGDGFIRDKVTRSGSVCATALVTMRADLKNGFEFWRGLSENDGLKRGDPRGTLREWLMDGTTRRSVSAPPFAVARAWNAFVEGDDLRILRISGAPIRIAGTTYTVAP
jgi:hypothetical protein